MCESDIYEYAPWLNIYDLKLKFAASHTNQSSNSCPMSITTRPWFDIALNIYVQYLWETVLLIIYDLKLHPKHSHAVTKSFM